jgi:hypothetical protein
MKKLFVLGHHRNREVANFQEMIALCPRLLKKYGDLTKQ